MSRMLILQLERFGRLSPDEKLALSGTSLRPRRLPAHSDFTGESAPDSLIVLLAGTACRYAVLPDGRRQILAYLLPGELCDRHTGDRLFTDHTIGALSDVKIATLTRDEVSRVSRRFPRIARAMELTQAVEHATSRQWLLGLGQRDALERTAHLLCELFTRLRVIGLAQDQSCQLSLRQSELADALGLSAVHINRTLGEMRRRGLATFVRHQLEIRNWRQLQGLCGFRPDYLFAGPPQLNGKEVREGSDWDAGDIEIAQVQQGSGAQPEQRGPFQD